MPVKKRHAYVIITVYSNLLICADFIWNKKKKDRRSLTEQKYEVVVD